MIFPAKRKQTEIQTLRARAQFAGCDIAPATSKTGHRKRAEPVSLKEIQTFRNRLRLPNDEAAKPTMPSPQTSRIWLEVDISGTGTGMTPTLSTLLPLKISVPSAAKYPACDWPKFETAENVPSPAGPMIGMVPV